MAGVVRSANVLTALSLAATGAEGRQMHDVRNHLLPAPAQALGGHLAIYHQMSLASTFKNSVFTGQTTPPCQQRSLATRLWSRTRRCCNTSQKPVNPAWHRSVS